MERINMVLIGGDLHSSGLSMPMPAVRMYYNFALNTKCDELRLRYGKD